MQMKAFVVTLLCLLVGRSYSFLSVSTSSIRTTMKSSAADTTLTGTLEKIPVLDGIRDVIDRYDTFLLDMWGVMHDGITTYEGVKEVVEKLREHKKDLVIVSNSSKRQDNSIKMLTKLGFQPKEDFSLILTSGEITYQLLSGATPESSALAPQPWDTLEVFLNKATTRKVYCFGSGEGDAEYVASCGCQLASMDEADLIVARGTFTLNDGSTVVHKDTDGEEVYYSTYRKQLELAAPRKIPMIVANPDKVRPDADRSPMPGTIGRDYAASMGLSDEESLDLIKYVGKPFSDVYEIALRGKDRSRVCMVGDALETDVTGGSSFDIDTLWIVNDGIHNMEVDAKGNGSFENGCNEVLAEFNSIKDTYARGRQLKPTVILPHFRW